jgi:hypothetical protein
MPITKSLHDGVPRRDILWQNGISARQPGMVAVSQRRVAATVAPEVRDICYATGGLSADMGDMAICGP